MAASGPRHMHTFVDCPPACVSHIVCFCVVSIIVSVCLSECVYGVCGVFMATGWLVGSFIHSLIHPFVFGVCLANQHGVQAGRAGDGLMRDMRNTYSGCLHLHGNCLASAPRSRQAEVYARQCVVSSRPGVIEAETPDKCLSRCSKSRDAMRE